MEISRTQLENGLDVIVIELPHVHSIELGMFVRSGPRFETLETLGISHFCEHMLFRGTRSIPGTFQLHAEIERLGSPIGAATSRDFCQFNFAVPARNLERAVELFAEVMLEPAFDDIDLERRIVVEENLIDLNEFGTDINLENHSRAMLWPGSPLGRNILGSEANIGRFARGDLFAHHRRFYTATNCLFYVIGQADTATAVGLARRYLGRMLTGSTVPAIPVTRHLKGPLYKFIQHDDSQEELSLSFIAPAYTDPDHLPMLALHNTLVDGVSSRLQWRICERMGMSYDIDAHLESYFDTGALDVDSSVGRGKLVSLLREILLILEDLRTQPITGTELEKARERCRFANEAALDSPSALANWLVATELYHVAPSIEETLERMGRMTETDIQGVARRVFTPSRMALVVIGRGSRAERNQLIKLIGQMDVER